VRPEQRRKKKLIVAFHFQYANQTGWKCDDCRRAGLETRRRCGWKSDLNPATERIVWARRQVSVQSCPKSFITADSLSLLDEFNLWKLCPVDLRLKPARIAEGILYLENEFRAEIISGTNQEKHEPSRQR
jgi:hypothetical protein